MTPTLSGSFAALRKFAQPPVPVERCDLCKVAIGSEHPHLLEIASRRLLCSCPACAVLFSGASDAKFRRVPPRAEFLPDFCITDAQWESLYIPIGVAFLVRSSAVGGVVAVYPSPAGATESQLPTETWLALEESAPFLTELAPDVEALLVNRLNGARDHYLTSIDQCYRLVGLVRTHWRGFSGGTEVWDAIDRFFAELKERGHA
jgi:hypothetical protein